MSENKKPSGSEYRKRARERSEREDALLKKMPSLDTFFSKSKTTSNNDSSESLLDASVKSVLVESSKSKSEIQVAVPSTSANTLNKTLTENFPEQLADGYSHFNVTDEKAKHFKNVNDPALWEINEELREYFAIHGIIQNDEGDFSKSIRKYSDQNRFLNKNVFFKKLVNGEVVKRCHLVYSKSTGRIYCAPCKLCGGTTSLGTDGFNDWKNAHIIHDHDNNAEHRACLRKYLGRSNLSQRIDSKLMIQYQGEVQYWKNRVAQGCRSC